MRIKQIILVSLTLIFSLSSRAADSSIEKTYRPMAQAYFPQIHNQVLQCVLGWENEDIIPASDRRALEAGYMTHIDTLFSQNHAPGLRSKFQALADYWNVKPMEVVKLFGCARWYTASRLDGKNIFVSANEELLKFPQPMIKLLYKNIEKMYEDFAGDAKTREGKITNINAHLKLLEQMKSASPKVQDGFHAHDATFKFIVLFKDDDRQKALNFAILVAQSSLEIVKEFEPPTAWQTAGIIFTSFWNMLNNLS
jgi:hypothetical protein